MSLYAEPVLVPHLDVSVYMNLCCTSYVCGTWTYLFTRACAAPGRVCLYCEEVCGGLHLIIIIVIINLYFSSDQNKQTSMYDEGI
jgi:hypothetical protein